jgi:polar amino acid transport system permease protein
MPEFTLWDILRNLLLAARWTVALSCVAFLGGTVVGLLLLLMRLSGRPILGRLVGAYVQLFQGTPLLMQLFLLYFGFAMLGVNTSAWVAACVALTLYATAIPRGQWEASASLALSFGQQFRHIILPQALRIAVAPTVGFLVQVVKGTALASVIGFVELTKAGGMIANVTYEPMLTYACVAGMYFALCFPISLYARVLERKLA